MTWNQYPPPSYAAHAWFMGDRLNVAFPGDPGHKVVAAIDLATLRNMAQISPFQKQRFTLDERKTLQGLYAMLSALKAREHAVERPTIGQASAPTQHDLDLIMKALGAGKVTKIEKKKKADKYLTLEDLDF